MSHSKESVLNTKEPVKYKMARYIVSFSPAPSSAVAVTSYGLVFVRPSVTSRSSIKTASGSLHKGFLRLILHRAV